jgi:predicted DCC family thiol-disulfide oxidoreductase YuxK
MDDSNRSVVLFDGVCSLCQFAVRFILEREEGSALAFASLQGTTARELASNYGRSLPAGDPESILFVEGGRLFEGSDAALRIAGRLRSPWKWLRAFLWIPRLVRDPVYRFIARNRYRWFGKTEQCLVPTPETRARFLP